MTSKPVTAITTTDLNPLFFGFGQSLNNILSEFWNDGVNSSLSFTPQSGYPPTNYKINKSNQNAIIQCALAGFKKQDIKVSVKNNTLEISANKITQKRDQSVDIVYNGIAGRQFTKSFACTEEYRADKAQVSFEDGILKIQIPKIKRNVKQITIK